MASSTKIEVETPSGVTIEGEDTTLYFFEGPTARFLLSREEGNFQQGDRVSITVTASDTFGNIVTSESRSIALAANSSIKGLGPLSFENGTATVSIRSNVTQVSNFYFFSEASMILPSSPHNSKTLPFQYFSC